MLVADGVARSFDNIYSQNGLDPYLSRYPLVPTDEEEMLDYTVSEPLQLLELGGNASDRVMDRKIAAWQP